MCVCVSVCVSVCNHWSIGVCEMLTTERSRLVAAAAAAAAATAAGAGSD